MDSSDEYWSVLDENGVEVSLNQYAWSVTTFGGSPRAFPDLRGEEPVYAFRAGSEFRPKIAEARTITLSMFVNGSDPDSPNPPDDPDTQFNENWLALQRLFWTPTRQVTLFRRWRVRDETSATGWSIRKASALAQIAGAMEPEMSSRSRATFTVDLLLSDPYFYGDPKTVVLSPSLATPTMVLNEGSAATTGFGCEVQFPLSVTKESATSGTDWETFVSQFAGDTANYTELTAAGSTTTVVQGGSWSFSINAFQGFKIKFLSGELAGVVRQIVTSYPTNPTAMTVSPALPSAPAAGTEYVLYAGPQAFWPMDDAGTRAKNLVNPGSCANRFWDAVYGGSVFVAVGDGGAVMSSTNGTSWTQRVGPYGHWKAVTYGGSTFVAVGSSFLSTTKLMSSTNGTTWTQRSFDWVAASWGSPASGDFGPSWYGAAFGNSVFVAVGSQSLSTGDVGRVISSADGITWTARTAASGLWKDVTYGNSLFVAVGDGGAVMTSADGITWTARTGVSGDWKSVTYSGSVFVAVSDSGAVMSSTNGTTWTARTGTGGYWWATASDGTTAVAVGYDGKVMSSTNGTTWTARTGKSGDWRGLTYGNSLFVAVGPSGSVMTSADGATWTSRTGTWPDALLAEAVDGGGAEMLLYGTTGKPTTTTGKVVKFAPESPTKGRILACRNFYSSRWKAASGFSILFKTAQYSDQVIARFDSEFSSYISVETMTTGQVKAVSYNGYAVGSVKSVEVVSPMTLTDGEWHQVGVSGTGTGVLTLYVDGRVVASVSDSLGRVIAVDPVLVQVGGLQSATGTGPGSKMFSGQVSSLTFLEEVTPEAQEQAYRAVFGKSKGILVRNDYFVGDTPRPDIHQSHWVKFDSSVPVNDAETVKFYLDRSVATIVGHVIDSSAVVYDNNYVTLRDEAAEMPPLYAPVQFSEMTFIEGLVAGQTYYVETVDEVSRRFSVTETLGGARVQFRRRLWWGQTATLKVFVGEFPITGAVSSYGSPQWITLYPGLNRITLTDLKKIGLTVPDGQSVTLTYREPYV